MRAGTRRTIPADPVRTVKAPTMQPFFEPRHMPCEDCGASVARDEREGHVCDQARWLDYVMFRLRDEVGAFDEEFRAYLRSPHGRFDAWLAARERERREDG